MLLIFGTQDPHIYEHERHTIINALENTKVHHHFFAYEVEHTLYER
jgi:carboxymethylenebutenolidase